MTYIVKRRERDETWWVLKIDRTEPTSLEIEDLVEVIEKKPRESLQRVQYAKAIDHINNGLSNDKQLMVIHMDLKTWSCELFPCLLMVGFASLAHSDFLHCQLTTTSLPDHTLREQNDVTSASSSTSMNEPKFGIIEILPIVLQKGVLRTNCIDSRDRTNRAQIVDGLVGLGRQLKALVQTKGLEIHIEEPLSSTLMLFYEEMGDALALQFTGSAAQNKEFWKQKGQWSAMNKLTRNIQHFVSNAYMVSEKQNSPNMS
uniref:SAC domain-containing protein n=1 Tax=Oryza rufipogon TaxID=4529 RepID=A0A0E0QYL3_ORYRU